MATYGPGIDQSQHTKSVSHIINSGRLVLEKTVFLCGRVC